MKLKYLLIFLVLLVIFIISLTLGSKNDQVITFNFLVAQGEFHISTLLASLFGLGFLLGWVICGLFWLKARLLLQHARIKISKLEQRLNDR